MRKVLRYDLSMYLDLIASFEVETRGNLTNNNSYLKIIQQSSFCPKTEKTNDGNPLIDE